MCFGRVVESGATDAPWSVATQIDALFVWPTPAWPGRLRWVQSGKAGMNHYPEWLFDVSQVTCARGGVSDEIAEYVLAAIYAAAKPLHRWRCPGLSTEFPRARTASRDAPWALSAMVPSVRPSGGWRWPTGFASLRYDGRAFMAIRMKRVWRFWNTSHSLSHWPMISFSRFRKRWKQGTVRCGVAGFRKARCASHQCRLRERRRSCCPGRRARPRFYRLCDTRCDRSGAAAGGQPLLCEY